MSVTTDINYWTITLKSWISDFVTELTLQEKYGSGICDCDWNQLIMANQYIEILQCYTPLSYVSGVQGDLGEDTIPSTVTTLHDYCYTDSNESQIKKIFMLASGIINKTD